MGMLIATPSLFLSGILIELFKWLLLPLPLVYKPARHWHLRERLLVSRHGRIQHDSLHPVNWIHAASAGEVRVLEIFLSLRRKRFPNERYIVTATTRTGVDYLRSLSEPDIIETRFLPVDSLFTVNAFVTRYAVRRVWIMETELWPALLWVCAQRTIPVGVVNARMEQNSFRWYHRFSFIMKPLAAHLDPVLAQNPAYAQRFISLGTRDACVHITGNIKQYRRIHPSPPDQRREIRRHMNIGESDRVLTAGCVRKGEGPALRKAITHLQKNGNAFKCIIVPRHIRDIPVLINELALSVTTVDEPVITTGWDVCIVNKFGILDTMYMIADAAFVGGTFVNVGGHNMWEPACRGLPVFFGPCYYTQHDSCTRLMEAGIGFETTNGTHLAESIERLFRNYDGFKASMKDFIVQSETMGDTVEEWLR